MMEFSMADHIIESTSESEQMYLITIASLIEDGLAEPIPLNAIAQEMSVLPVSVNQMVRKLEGAGLLHYSPYKGVELTPQGRQIARRTLRNRRLWEVFLVEQLNLPIAEADAMACTMEHVTTNEVAQRLSILLGEPTVSPGGKRIPPTEGEQEIQDWIPLKDLEVGSMGQIAQVQSQPDAKSFLLEQGLRPGATVSIKAIGKNRSRLVQIADGFVQLSEGLAGEILILMSTPDQTSSPENSP
jgi:DtxR family Mn-dependent transcriptional regulator